jgi:hypothetical protein
MDPQSSAALRVAFGDLAEHTKATAMFMWIKSSRAKAWAAIWTPKSRSLDYISYF